MSTLTLVFALTLIFIA